MMNISAMKWDAGEYDTLIFSKRDGFSKGEDFVFALESESLEKQLNHLGFRAEPNGMLLSFHLPKGYLDGDVEFLGKEDNSEFVLSSNGSLIRTKSVDDTIALMVYLSPLLLLGQVSYALSRIDHLLESIEEKGVMERYRQSLDEKRA